MTRRKTLPALTTALLVWLAAAPAWCADRLDADLESCLAASRDKPAAAALTCTREADQAWNTRLNAAYAALLQTLDKGSRAHLVAAQRRWLDYRESDAGFAGAAWRAEAGSMFGAMIASNRLDELRARVRTLETYRLAR